MSVLPDEAIEKRIAKALAEANGDGDLFEPDPEGGNADARAILRAQYRMQAGAGLYAALPVIRGEVLKEAAARVKDEMRLSFDPRKEYRDGWFAGRDAAVAALLEGENGE